MSQKSLYVQFRFSKLCEEGEWIRTFRGVSFPIKNDHERTLTAQFLMENPLGLVGSELNDLDRDEIEKNRSLMSYRDSFISAVDNARKEIGDVALKCDVLAGDDQVLSGYVISPSAEFERIKHKQYEPQFSDYMYALGQRFGQRRVRKEKALESNPS